MACVGEKARPYEAVLLVHRVQRDEVVLQTRFEEQLLRVLKVAPIRSFEERGNGSRVGSNVRAEQHLQFISRPTSTLSMSFRSS